MLRKTPNRRHRWLAPANSDLESWYESWPGYHPVEVYAQAGPTQVSLHNQAVEALARDVEAFKIQVQTAADIEIERIKAYLARASHVHEQQIEALSKLYRHFSEALGHLSSVWLQVAI